VTILSNTYTYRVLKSSWGVRVILRAETRTGAPRPGAMPVADGLFVLDATDGPGLSPEQMGMLRKGLELVAAEVIAAVPEKPVTVEVQDVEHNELDYQDEGLAAAVLGWAIAEYGLAPREIPVTYESSPKRRYVFDFDAVRPAS
jgi:hypothetical protein